MKDFRSMSDRYDRDPVFHAMVNALEDMIEKLEMTPTEVREAAMYAVIRFEYRHLRNILPYNPADRFEQIKKGDNKA